MNSHRICTRLAAVALVALAVAGIGAAGATAATPPPTPNAEWSVTSRVVNDTPYAMRFSQVHVNTCTTRRSDPGDIAPGKSASVTFDNDCFARGVETQLTYDLLNSQGKVVGYLRAVANLEWKFSITGYDIDVHGIIGTPGVSASSTYEKPVPASRKWLAAQTTFSGGSATAS